MGNTQLVKNQQQQEADTNNNASQSSSNTLPQSSSNNDPISTSKEKQRFQFNQNELIVHYYIRQIQTLLKNKQIIPKIIFDVVLKFYFEAITVFFARYCYESKQSEVGVIDLENNRNLTIKLNKLLIGGQLAKMCHISNINISNNTMKTDSKFNGIFGFQKKTPFLLLYSKNHINEKNEVMVKNEYVSSESINFRPLHQPQFIINNNEKIIICANNGKFYQLKLENMDYSNNFSKFEEIEQKKQKFILNSPKKYLNMIYLSNKQSIFAVECYNYDDGTEPDLMPYLADMTINGGIFNVNTNHWIDVKPFNYKQKTDGIKFNFMLCYHENNEIIYFLTNLGDTISYNLNTNQWSLLTKQIFKESTYDRTLYRGNSIFWAENDKLHYLAPSSYIPQNDPFKLYQFDLKNNEKKWIKCDQNFDHLPTSKTGKMFFYDLFQ
eukprot:25101_1